MRDCGDCGDCGDCPSDCDDDDNVMIMLDNMTIMTSMNSPSSPLLLSLANRRILLKVMNSDNHYNKITDITLNTHQLSFLASDCKARAGC